MSLSYGILGFLTYGSMTGYELAKAFGSSVQFFWHAQTSQIYLELGKLEQKGMVAGAVVLQTEKPNKKVYSITDAGRTAFLQWLAQGELQDSPKLKDVFLMKVFFSGNRPHGESCVMLRQFVADCRQYLCSMDTIPAAIAEYGQFVEPAQTLYWQFAADFGARYMTMCVEWAEACIAKLEAL